MRTPAVSRFQYTRAFGDRRTYDVTLNVMRKDCGVYAYAAWVQFRAEYKGSGLMLPLVADTHESAINEARTRIESDIDNLIGVVE
ncbi:hypothetical protein [Paraburkholderia terrae]|uniref:hypothetical protein n=1 Tax=Paraburkholderia terrae TaxID=311230 RepID=UPI0020502FF3|nr:hypothetical protein [Paraburkholderia terrae]BDC45515.1 hypothetical protein PTKU15_88120 [Paraburkholderia terrae]